jgi:predicted dehydrogenase
MLRIGLIGAGWHATADHAPALRLCAGIAEFRGVVGLAGVYDVDRAKAADLAARFGFHRAYDSLDAMLPEVDAVLSIVPPAAMASTLARIVQHRLPVLVEKPLGRDLAEARTIAAMLDGHPHMVSLNRRFDPGVRLAHQWLLEQRGSRGGIGQMRRRDRAPDGFAWSTGIHMADLLVFLFGPLKLQGVNRKGVVRIGLLITETRRSVDIALRSAGPSVEESVRVMGDGWSLSLQTGTHQPWSVQCWRDRELEIDRRADPSTPAFVRNGCADETAAFLRGVLTSEMPGPSAADAMAGTSIAAELEAPGWPNRL